MEVYGALSGKTKRFIGSFLPIEPIRKGKCMPDKCSTLDGINGAACCKLGLNCFLLNKREKLCNVYKIRPTSCRSFPRTKEELKLVKNCGFYWD